MTPDPEEISIFLFSSMMIGPSVVHAPDPPVAAVSAEIAEPPEAPVSVTAARAEGVRLRQVKATAVRPDATMRFDNR